MCCFPGTRPKPLLSQSVRAKAYQRGMELAGRFVATQVGAATTASSVAGTVLATSALSAQVPDSTGQKE